MTSPQPARIPIQNLPTTAPVAQPHPAGSRLEKIAGWLQRHKRVIGRIQWLVILAYAALILTPALLPLPAESARIHTDLVRAAQFLFWGIWWPFVILSMLVLGRFWCGVLCPEGALSEAVSKVSLNWKPIPRWLKWPGWPFVAFVGTTVYGQMISVYDYAKPALIILGGSTLAAMALAYFYGRERRVWCRYLCPVSGVFHVLARLAPMALRVDGARWQANKALATSPVICAPLINIKQLNSMAECHQCFRCHGYRNAVHLNWRTPGREIIAGNNALTGWHHALILFGIFGLAGSAFAWSASPYMVMLKQALVQFAVAQEWWWALEPVGHWWLFTDYPQANDVFNWIDGAALLLYLSGGTMLVGGWLLLMLMWSARILTLPWQRLSEAMTPLAAVTLFVGLSMTTVSLLRADGIDLPAIAPMRAALLIAGIVWSLYLLARISAGRRLNQRLLAGLIVLLGLSLPLSVWVLLFWIW